VQVSTAGLWFLGHDGKDRLPISRDGLVGRILARGVGALQLGDLLSATARKPAR
jgi:hypothetical protein